MHGWVGSYGQLQFYIVDQAQVVELAGLALLLLEPKCFLIAARQALVFGNHLEKPYLIRPLQRAFTQVLKGADRLCLGLVDDAQIEVFHILLERLLAGGGEAAFLGLGRSGCFNGLRGVARLG